MSTDHTHQWYIACTGCDLRPDNVQDHFVTFTDTSWIVEHSLQCRMDGEMQRGCKYQRYIDKITIEPDGTRGRWRIVCDAVGLLRLELV